MKKIGISRLLAGIFFLIVLLLLLQKNLLLTGHQRFTMTYNHLAEEGISMFRQDQSPEQDLRSGQTYQRLPRFPVEFRFRRPYFTSEITIATTFKSYDYSSLWIGIPWAKTDSWHPRGLRYFPYDLPQIRMALTTDIFERFDEDERTVFLQKKDRPLEEGFSEDAESVSDDLEQQREERPQFHYVSQEEFYETSIDEPSVIGFYDAMDPSIYKIPGVSEETGEVLSFGTILRGSHHLLVYVSENGTLNFQFGLKDHNLSTGADPIALSVTNALGEQVMVQEIADDGDQRASRSIREQKPGDIHLDGLSRGVYTISIETTKDVWIEGYTTTNLMTRWIDRLALSNPDQKTTFYTNLQSILFVTYRTRGLQTIMVDGRSSSTIDVVGRPKEIFLGKGFHRIDVPISDAVITFHGTVSFQPEVQPFFNTTWIDIRTAKLEDFDLLVLGKEWGAVVKQGDKETTVSRTFQTKDLRLQRRELSVGLNIPQFDRNIGDLIVTKMEIEVKRKSLSDIFHLIIQRWL